MAVNRVKFQDIVASQLPSFVRDDFPLLTEFLQQYYISQEQQGGVYDLVQNLDQYVKVDELFNLKNSTVLLSDISYNNTTIDTSANTNFTEGFPEKNGLIKIDDEIIRYEYKTDFSFVNCARGFSGITSYIGSNTPDELVFSSSEVAEHASGATIYNLNILFLQQFFKKLKNQFAPGFTERAFYSGLDQRNFVFNADSFYKSKGTDQSFEILFRALYGEDVQVIKPSEYLLRPSNADYKITQDFVVEEVSGNPLDLQNLTLFQDSTGARGSVTNVEQIQYDQGQYYQLSIDYGYQRDVNVTGTVFSEFEANPQTKILNTVSIGSTIIDVDSTVGFAKTGNLIAKDVDNNLITIQYLDKNDNQFLNVSGLTASLQKASNVRFDDYSYAYTGINTSNQIRVRITSTLKSINFDDENYYYKKGDGISIKSLGIEDDSEKSANWLLNVKTKWSIQRVSVVDITERIYEFETYDEHFLNDGYSIIAKDVTVNSEVLGNVVAVRSSTTFTAKLSSPITIQNSFEVENQPLKGKSTNYPQLSRYFANIQNTYSNFDGDLIVSSNSIPNYSVSSDPYSKIVRFSGTFSRDQVITLTTNTDHGFYTGDSVWYKPFVQVTTVTTPDGNSISTETESKFEDLDAGIFYIKRLNSTQVSISRSKSDLFSGNYVTLNGTVTNNEFIYYNFYQKSVQPQKIYRRISSPVNKSGSFETKAGFSGILINGVEVLNYKSTDTITYGDIRSFDIQRGGQNYDVINPPLLQIDDENGSGAAGDCCVTGNLKRIDILDTGFDYIGKPEVKISGGNGKGASAEVKLSSIIHTSSFLANSSSSVNVSADTIGFSTYHKFAQNERVIYDAGNETKVGGLSTDASYYVGVVDTYTIKLYKNSADSSVGINTVNLTSIGSGVQNIRSTTRKNIVTDVVVINSGSGYQNKKRTIPTSGVSTSLNQFKIPNHEYQSKEIVRYSGTSVSGLSSTKDYYVVKVDDNAFSLSEVGVGSTATDYYYNNNILVNIESEGTGSFNYKPITVTIEGNIGVSTSGQDLSCRVQPIFRGSIESIDLTSFGSEYGSSEVINFNRQPDITFKSGKDAILVPIINNGSIVNVSINNSGSEYNSPPDLKIISDTGNYASLTPILRNGRIVDVKIVKGGVGYISGKTEIQVLAAGSGARAAANIRDWNINNFERNINLIREDDGVLEQNIDNTSIQYSHLYAPRPLRETVYSISGNDSDNSLYGTVDLQTVNGIEVDNDQHSPIIGWAYDGNPIYGPYGFSDVTGGNVTRMESGYTLNSTSTNRPPYTLYPAGFFVEDFTYTGVGDLDEHNGRFCVTPDYPNGTYAYFATVNRSTDSSGPFRNYKRPVFPYLIGNTYKSEPNSFNFNFTSNQNDYDIEKSGLSRNTKFYYFNSDRSSYDYIFDSTKVQDQIIDITSSSIGSIESVNIVAPGTNYRVNDRVIFNTQGSGGSGTDARVSDVSGKTINKIQSASTSIYNVEFVRNNNNYLGFTSSSHGLKNSDVVQVSGISTSFRGFNGSYNVGVRSDTFVLTLGVQNVATTGNVAYFYVSGLLQYPYIRPNDILIIGSEKVKVLNIDSNTKRIRVLRAQEGTPGVAHTNGEILFESPRKFTFNVPKLEIERSYKINTELYFDPSESVGLGTALGTGVGTTITFSNPGVGATQIFVEPRSIYYQNHGLELNDQITYDANGGSSISYWNGISGFPNSPLSGISTLYAVPISKNFVGISSNRVGLGTDGYIGINTSVSLLYFTSVGTGNTHSFTTNYSNVISGQITRNVVTVSTANTHGLDLGDKVSVTVKPTTTTTVTVKYNDYNRRIVFDPRNFTAGDVDVNLNTIDFGDEYFSLGDRVIHTSSSPSGGLVNEKMYFVVPYNDTKVRLVEEKFELTLNNPNYVNITSASSGTLSKINPIVKAYRNNSLKFDLSDSSLSFINNSLRYSAFNFNIYSDKDFTSEFLTSGKTSEFEVTRSGSVGIDTAANVTLRISDYVPQNLYYEFTPDNLDIVPDSKSEIVVDKTVSNFNEIGIIKTKYDGIHVLSGVGTTTFTYSISEKPDISLYNSTNSVTTYSTNSPTAYGPISKIKIFNGGYGYTSLPEVDSVSSGIGSGAVLQAASESIGKILKTNFNNIGFEYPTDGTLNAIANLPYILKINPLTSFERIDVTSQGQNYLTSPDLIVLDGFTNEVVSDVDLEYNLGDGQVTILKNTFGIYNTVPKIIPINNSNGIGIASVSYNQASKTVRLVLDTDFSNSEDFPFAIGKNILVENLSVGVVTTGKGYNSENYNYSLFELTDVRPYIGGTGAFIEYSLDGIISSGDVPGNVDYANSAGRAIPESQFPTFNITLKTNDYYENEKVTSGSNVGIVQRWNSFSEYLFVSAKKNFVVGETVIGQSSNTQGVIESVLNFRSTINTGAGATIIDGWQTNSGILNDNLQRIPNNEYYQNLSYSLKSKVPYDTWDDSVSSLNHIAGFAKFSDLTLESIPDRIETVVTPQETAIVAVSEIIGVGDLNCFSDFDYVSETSITVDGKLVSDEIIFENRILSDYTQSLGNRVLTIDDVSSEFNSVARNQNYVSIIKEISNNITYQKLFAFVKDQTLVYKKQSSIITLLQKDGEGAYIQEYAQLDTSAPLGSFDYVSDPTGDSYDILFYPTSYELDLYDVSTVSFDINNNVTGIGSTNIGDVVLIDSFQTTVAAATTTTIVSISSTFRSSKLLVQIENNGEYSSSELNLIHDGSTVYSVEYADMTTDGSAGFGTFSPYISGSNIIVDFIPSVSVALTANANVVSIADTSAVGVSSVMLRSSNIISYQTNIASSPTPTANVIASYHSPMECGYFIISVEDLTNSQYEMFEMVVLNNDNDFYTDFANVYTGSNTLGSVGVNTADGGYQVTYTPIANAEMQVRTYSMQLYVYDGSVNESIIDFNNSKIDSKHAEYIGTLLNLKTKFNLRHDGKNIFHRVFDGSDSQVVDLTNNIVKIPDHFFVTGEKVSYTYPGVGTNQAIGIATTTIPGIGSTDKLPSNLYIVKRSDLDLKFASSAENALSNPPVTLNLTNVGVGNSHSLISVNKNTRVLVAVDNIIQSPIVSSGVEETLSSSITVDTSLTLSGVTSIFAEDYVQIDDEIMLVISVGEGGANNISVIRSQMGTEIANHGIGSTVTKLSGNFNIVENYIHFSTAPFGNVPLSNGSSESSENYDWTGITTSSKFQGRVFLRSGVINSSEETYSKNYLVDDISSQFTGINSSFVLTSGGSNIAGVSTDNAVVLINGIFQSPTGVQVQRSDYTLQETSGITSIRFTGGPDQSYGYDPNRSEFPMGGFIVSVGSQEGFGYQPLISAGGTAVVSVAGTIQSISIGNTGSGYREGIQTVVNVGVQTYSGGVPNIEFIGTAAVSGGHVVSVAVTNPGVGYTSTNPPIVVFDSPLPYSNIPLIYSSGSGSGQGATARIVVGQGSSVIDFEIDNYGYGYRNDDVLTVAIGGTTGIQTDTSKPFTEFQIFIDRVYSDQFSGWFIGKLRRLDNLDNKFDGFQKTFILTEAGDPFSTNTVVGSNIKLEDSMLVFINDILQDPIYSYDYSGGSKITFSEAPNFGDRCTILFYEGTDDVDTRPVDILETVKIGDTLNIDNNPELGQNIALDENERVVSGIGTIDTVITNPYSGPGITTDRSIIRPVTWCKQTVDKVVNGQKIGKSRDLYEPLVYPAAFIIKNVGINTNAVYVDTLRPLFNTNGETTDTTFQKTIKIISQDSIVGASATAVVSVAGTISSLIINNAGVGYTQAPEVTIANPVGLGSTLRASASATISGFGTLTSLTVTEPGTGYTSTNPPLVLIETPKIVFEDMSVSSYSGDYGIIVGVGTTVVSSQNQFYFDTFIPLDSFLRSTSYVGTAVSISGISTSDYFTLFNTNVSIGGTFASQDQDVATIGIGTLFLDCVYQVNSYEDNDLLITAGSTIGFTTTCRRLFVNVDTLGTGIAYTNLPDMGEFSWGKISLNRRTEPQTFNFYGNNGYTGITTSSLVTRGNSLKYKNYTN